MIHLFNLNKKNGWENMDIKTLFNNLKLKEISDSYIDSIRKTKPTLSNSDKRFLEKMISHHKERTKEEVLGAILLYSFWFPDEALIYSKKKGVFRYRIGGYKSNNSLYYLESLIKYKSFLQYSTENVDYLEMKINCEWMYNFYSKTEKKIVDEIEKHHKRRIRKNINGNKLETALFKELIVYMEMFFLWFDGQNETPNERDALTAYSREDVGEAISYIIYIYDDIIGINEKCNYWVDSHYILSGEIEKLILLACKILRLQELELLVDYFDYKISKVDNRWRIWNETNFEKSVRMGYAKTEMQSHIFWNEQAKNDDDCMSLNKMSEMIIKELEDDIIKKTDKGILCRYRIEFPTLLIDFMKKDIKEYSLFKEEVSSLKYMEKEMVSLDVVLLKKMVTQHANLGDVLLFQRFFVVIINIYNQIFLKENDKHVVVKSIGPVFEYNTFFDLINIIVNDKEKTKELIDLLTYNRETKLDLQYTPILRDGNKIYLSIAIVAMSNMLRNVISYSYMIKNQIVNSDDGEELMVKHCVAAFNESGENCMVFDNKNFKYQGRKGEIDVLVISDSYILIIECKAPITPTNNFEMRSEYEHLLKAEKQLNLSKSAFADKGFRKKYLQGLGVEEKNRTVMTCILLGNRIFTGFTGLSHPIRCFHELDMILNKGTVVGPELKMRIWKKEKYSKEDLIDFLSEQNSFICKLENALDKRYEVMTCSGKKVEFETYSYNLLHAHNIIKDLSTSVEKSKG